MRVLKSTLGCAIFSFAAFAGDIVLLFVLKPPLEWIDTILLALACAASLSTFFPFRSACARIVEEKGATRS